MTLRITASTATFAASQTGAKVSSTIANLTDYIPATASIHPMALTEAGGATPSDLLVTEVIIGSEKNPEVAHRVYKGPLVQIDSVMGALARDVVRVGALTPLGFRPDHGLEIEFTYDNGTTSYASTLLWDIQNQDLTEEFPLLLLELAEVVFLGPLALPDALRKLVPRQATEDTPAEPLPTLPLSVLNSLEGLLAALEHQLNVP